ncbi:MAG: hypothetical protein ACFB2X_06410 [Rivularia sp. (in: cyanobacteria)]
MEPLNLSNSTFTSKADRVYSDNGIFNPAGSNVKTLRGADEIVGNNFINSGFGFGVFVGVTSDKTVSVDAAALSGEANVNANGINNEGNIATNKGRDVVRGTATAQVIAVAQTVSEAITYANNLDADAVATTFANLNVNAIANGIKNSGQLATGEGSDSVNGEIDASIVAVATAKADATAIVQGIAQAPVNESLSAFAIAISQSIANGNIIATGINNVGGKITTARGGDTINAIATSDSANFAKASTSALAATTSENQVLALAVAEAIATVQDKAIAIDNSTGTIRTGKGKDNINATANAVDKAIAINNIQGTIQTGNGADTILADATGIESYGIFGGTIEMGDGADKLDASSFGGGVNIKMGNGKDFVEGFGDAIVNGGNGFDVLSLDSDSIDDFNISLGANNNKVIFEQDNIIMNTSNFELFNFNNGSLTLTYDELAANL